MYAINTFVTGLFLVVVYDKHADGNICVLENLSGMIGVGVVSFSCHFLKFVFSHFSFWVWTFFSRVDETHVVIVKYWPYKWRNFNIDFEYVFGLSICCSSTYNTTRALQYSRHATKWTSMPVTRILLHPLYRQWSDCYCVFSHTTSDGKRLRNSIS